MTLRSIRSDEHIRPANRRPGIIPGRRFALVLVLAAGAARVAARRRARGRQLAPIVSATVYSPSGTTHGVRVAGAAPGEPQCPPYCGPSDMNELGRQGFVDVPLRHDRHLGAVDDPRLPADQPDPDRRRAGSHRDQRRRDPRARTAARSSRRPDLRPGLRPTSTTRRGLRSCRRSDRRTEYDRPWRGTRRARPTTTSSTRCTDAERPGDADRDRGVRGTAAHRHRVRVADDGAGRAAPSPSARR